MSYLYNLQKSNYLLKQEAKSLGKNNKGRLYIMNYYVEESIIKRYENFGTISHSQSSQLKKKK